MGSVVLIFPSILFCASSENDIRNSPVSRAAEQYLLLTILLFVDPFLPSPGTHSALRAASLLSSVGDPPKCKRKEPRAAADTCSNNCAATSRRTKVSWTVWDITDVEFAHCVPAGIPRQSLTSGQRGADLKTYCHGRCQPSNFVQKNGKWVVIMERRHSCRILFQFLKAASVLLRLLFVGSNHEVQHDIELIWTSFFSL